MEEIKAYKCGYCGKLYQRKHACRRHEDNDCLKNPKIRPVCFDCEFMQCSEETEDVDCWATTMGYREVLVSRKFKRTLCRETGKKMYVNIHLPEEVTETLDDKGWQAMPTYLGGCEYAKLYRDDYDNRGEAQDQTPHF